MNTELSPLTPEAVAQMVADREAGTPGPWQYRPDQYDDWGVVKSGGCVICQARDPARLERSVLAEYRENGTDPWESNARRIARLPDLEAAYLTLAAENATLRASEAAALERMKVLEAGLADPVSVHANMLRGAIAMPSFANIKHLYAAEVAKARAEDAELIAASLSLKEIVEGVSGAMEHGTFRAEKGMRLKDTPEWVAFYVALAQIGAKP